MCDIATVTVNVQVNYPPAAGNDVAATNESTPVQINVLSNDSDPNGNLNPSTVQVVMAPANGSASASPTGIVTYTPNPGFSGLDNFTYNVSDELGLSSNTATVSVNVLPNLPPEAQDDVASTTDGTAVFIPVLGNDSDPNGNLDPNSLSTAGLQQPTYGSVQALPGTGLSYTPNPGYTGYDQFEYSVCDFSNPAPLCDVATVTVLIDCGTVNGYNLIKGKVFEDANQDGQNIGEAGQAGVTVLLFDDNNQNGLLDAGDAQASTATTNSQGEYAFSLTPVYFTPGSLTASISQDADDAWEKDSGSVEHDKDDHEIGKAGFFIGLRFTNVGIPAGAVITNAYVEFLSSRDEDNVPAGVDFYAELSSAPAPIVEQNYNISSRTVTGNSVSWAFGEWFEDQYYQTPDLSNVIQEVVSLPTWNAGSSLFLIAEGTGTQKRKFYAHDKNPAWAPTLHVDYLIPGQDEYHYIVQIDPGTLPGTALLTTDNIETAAFTGLGQTDCLNDFGFFPGFPPVVSIASPTDGTTLTSLQTVSLQANASDPDGYVTHVEFFVNGSLAGTDNTAPYSLTYNLISEGLYTLEAEAIDNSLASTFSDPVVIDMIFIPTPVTFSLQALDDDAREKNDGNIDLTKNNPHELGKEGYIAVRFPNVTIPPGAPILSANVVFKSQNDEDNQPSSSIIYGEASPSPSPFVDIDGDISARPKSTNSVNWAFGPWFKNVDYPSPDLSAIVQERVNAPGWQSGNAMAFLFQATGSQRRKGYSFEGGQSNAPRLEITYLGGGQAAMATASRTAPESRAKAEASTTAPVIERLNIYPNPTAAQVFIELESREEMPASLNLYDASGRLVQSGKYLISQGRNKLAYRIGEVSAGLYFLHLKGSKYSRLERIMVVK